MRKNKIPTEDKKESLSKKLIIISFIIILVLINSFLAYSIIKNLSFFENSPAQAFLEDTTRVKIQVEVLNGCGVAGVADKLTEYLRTNGIDVVNLGNYRSFEIESSIIISRNENIHNAEIVAALVGLDQQNIIQQINYDYLLDVTFILGKDYRNLIPLKKR